jgi:demethylmenaquinone methyltransferase/2-methoxy-6-polyprenyl-1,4-benzoquinol methylase
VLPAFSRIASKTPEAYSYLSESIVAWPDQHELGVKVSDAGYKDVVYRNLTFGIVAVHVGFKPMKAAAKKVVAKKPAAKKAAK